MYYYVYLILSRTNNKIFSYVGYTKDIKNRLKLHNSNKGAKFTRGKKWSLIYSKKYKTKNKAMSEEYKLKNDKKRRKMIKLDYLKKNENFNITSI